MVRVGKIAIRKVTRIVRIVRTVKRMVGIVTRIVRIVIMIERMDTRLVTRRLKINRDAHKDG